MDDKTKPFPKFLSEAEKKLWTEDIKGILETGNQSAIDNLDKKFSSLNPEDALEMQQITREINDKLKAQKGLKTYEEAQIKRVAQNIPSASTLKSVEEAAPILNEKNIHKAGSEVADAIEKAQNIAKFKRIFGALGSRAKKAIPYVGTALGLSAAKDALAKGDKLGAALETASAFDPTPISDIALAAKDVYDIATEPSEQKSKEQKSASPEAVKNMVKVLGGEPDVSPKKASMMVGEKPSKDVSGENYSTYDNYIKQQKRKLGY
jgi:hypothetical protein